LNNTLNCDTTTFTHKLDNLLAGRDDRYRLSAT
jgi:hypothetical protein